MRLRGDRFEPYDDRGKIWRSVSGDLAGSAVIRMFYEILNYVSSF